MPFMWKPKANSRRKVNPEIMKSAVKRVLENGTSVNAAATEFNVDRKTLGRYVNKVKKGEETEFRANYVSCQILSDAEEEKLEQYLLQSSRLNYGLTPTITRKFAHQYALANGRKVPQNWTRNEMASYDWLRGFMSRHQALSLRTPQATSLSRGTAFNKTTVQEFYNNLKTVFSKFSYGPEAIFNIDETGITTVQKPGKVIAPKGEKQVSRATSAERGTLVTACCAISAIGEAVPPFFIFPRKRLNDRMLFGAPPGSDVVAHESGWMTGNNFEKFLMHFVRFTKCSVSKPVVIVLDNHESHITPSGLQICKDNGITLVTLPHTSHKLQPLDHSVFGPFKTYYNAAADDYMVTHPGQTITIYEIPQLVAKAFPKAFTPINIQKGFACTGIWPFNSNCFSETDFLSSYVTDRDDPEVAVGVIAATSSTGSTTVVEPSTSSKSKKVTHSSPKLNTRITQSRQPLPGSEDEARFRNSIASSPTSHSCGVTPEQLRPFPKAPARKMKGDRKRVVSRISTDSPVRKQIEADYEARAAKKMKIINRKKGREDKMKKQGKELSRNEKKKKP